MSESEFDCEVLTRQAVEAFVSYVASQNLSLGSLAGFLGAIRELAVYQRENGNNAFCCQTSVKDARNQYRRPYIPSDEEINAFLSHLNGYLLTIPLDKRHFDLSCAVMVRLYALCGLRTSEATDLLLEEVRFNDNTLYIRHSKGDKDRIVPFSDGLAGLLKRCDQFLSHRFPNRQYFFINTRGARIANTNVARWLRYRWKECFGDKDADQTPTAKDLRHTFVVRTVDRWGGEAGADFKVNFPLLAKYLGHSSVQQTLYYYHQFRGIGQLAEGWIMGCDDVAREVHNAIL